jgi:hypothetical protein
MISPTVIEFPEAAVEGASSRSKILGVSSRPRLMGLRKRRLAITGAGPGLVAVVVGFGFEFGLPVVGVV